ncbi:MAG: phage tail tape measure protein, partial [Chloroherpetonaceae bacterium]
MQTALEYIIKINTADAKANLANFSNSAKSELAKAARIDVKLDAASAKQSAVEATQAISKGFIDAKARAQELFEAQRNVVASLQLMGRSGTKEFASAQASLMQTRQEVEKFDKAIQKADVRSFSEKLKGMGSAAQSVLGPLGMLGTGLSLAGAVSSAVEMEKATARIRTLGGAAKDIAPDLQKLALSMSRDIPISATEMQTAMYDALSSGINANTEDMKAFTETAGKLAVGGGETIGNTVKLLSSITNAYGQSASQAAENSDILFTAVNLGVITIPELNQSLSQVVPTAAAMGVNLKNVGASLAVMTSNGVPAAQATTRLNALLNELQKPSTALAPILTKAGISMESIANEGVPATLEKITGELQSMGINASAVFSSMEATSAFNTLTVGGEKFQQTLDQFSNSA